MGVGVYVLGLLWGLEPDLPLVGLAVVAFTVVATQRPRAAFTSTPLALAVAAFVVATGVSAMLAVDPWRSLRLSTPLVPGALLFVLVAGHFDDDDVPVLSLACTLFALMLAASIALTSWRFDVGDPTALVAALASPILVVPNDAVLLAVVAPFALVPLSSKDPLPRLLAGSSLFATAIAIGMLQSRIAVLALVFGLACAAWCGGGRWIVRWLAALLAMVIVVDAVLGFPFAAKVAGTTVWNTRVALWIAALAMWRDAVLLGHGPRTFGVSYRDYLGELDLPSWLPVDARVAPWAHNLFLEVLAEQGVIGLGLLIALVAGGLVIARRACRVSSAEARMCAAGAFGALAAFLLAGLVELTLLRHWVVAVFLLLIGVVAHLARTTRKEARS